MTGLVAGNSSSALSVKLNTGTAGTFAGSSAIAFLSSGAGTTGAADATVGNQNVALTGRVYTPAIAQVNTPTVDFGIVHKGDVVAARTIGVNNVATGALSDVLRGRDRKSVV